jgi:hypothetical protein
LAPFFVGRGAEVFVGMSFVVLSAAESSVALLPGDVFGQAWEAMETMLMPMSSLGRPLARVPVILT